MIQCLRKEGTDMNAFIYTTEQGSEFVKRRLFDNGNVLPGAATLTLGDEVNGGFRGFGVALTGSSCYMLSKMDGEEREKLLRSIYGKEGLNLSVARLSIGSSDYSPDVYSYCDEEDESLSAFSIERDFEYIIPMIKEVIKINPGIRFFASPWSPPGWMKTGKNMCGGYMRREFVSVYARYIVKFLKAYEKEGIFISAVTVQNEPETQQNGVMPACIWHPDIEAEFVKELKAELSKENMKTEIWLYDHNFSGWQRVMYQLEEFPFLADAASAVAFHYYEGTPKMAEKIKEKYPGLSWNFTEGGPRLYDNYDSDWCKWAVTAARALSSGADSFTGWNLVLDERGGPLSGLFGCGGLVTLDTRTGGITKSGQYKAFCHLSKFIRPGAKVYKLLSDTFGTSTFAYPAREIPVEGIAAVNADSSHVLVLANPAKEKKAVEYSYNGKHYFAILWPNSVATVVFE